jgi:purine-binding chemotaxis protein CheW
MKDIEKNVSETFNDNNQQMAMFSIGDEIFGVGINIIKEIVRYPKIISVPKTPDYVTGLSNLRGNVLPIINSRIRLGLSQIETTDDTRVLVIESGRHPVGLVVDKVSGVINIEGMTLENPPPILNSGVDSKYISHVLKGKDNEKIVMELNIDSMCALNFSGEISKSIGYQDYKQEKDFSESVIDEIQLVTFLVSNEEYGFPIEIVKEVLRVGNFTEVPNSLSYIVGILTIRNTVLPLIDIRKLFGMRLLIDEVNIELDYVERNTLHWIDQLKQSVYSGKHFKSDINTENSYISNWVEKFRTSSETIGKYIQGLKYLNLRLFEKGNLINNKLKELKTEEVQELFDKEIVAISKQISSKIIELKEVLRKDISEDQRILVVDINKMVIGILVDRMQQVIRIQMNIMEQPPAIFSSGKSEVLKSIVKIDEGKRIILLFNENKLLGLEQIKEFEEMKKDDTTSEQKVSLIEDSKNDEIQIVTFKLDNEEFGIKIEQVQEINRIDKITSVPQVQSFIEGMMNLRGNVIPLIDLRKRFGLDVKEHTEATRVIIVTILGKLTGLIVDSVSEVLRLSLNIIEQTPEIIRSKNGTEFLTGICKLEKEKRMILLISIDKILTSEEQGQLDSVEKEIKIE